MKTVTPADSDILRTRRWANSVSDWDLARELDSCKESRDAYRRQLGLLAINCDQRDYNSLVSKDITNQQRIEIIEVEIRKRKGRL